MNEGRRIDKDKNPKLVKLDEGNCDNIGGHRSVASSLDLTM